MALLVCWCKGCRALSPSCPMQEAQASILWKSPLSCQPQEASWPTAASMNLSKLNVCFACGLFLWIARAQETKQGALIRLWKGKVALYLHLKDNGAHACASKCFLTYAGGLLPSAAAVGLMLSYSGRHPIAPEPGLRPSSTLACFPRARLNPGGPQQLLPSRYSGARGWPLFLMPLTPPLTLLHTRGTKPFLVCCKLQLASEPSTLCSAGWPEHLPGAVRKQGNAQLPSHSPPWEAQRCISTLKASQVLRLQILDLIVRMRSAKLSIHFPSANGISFLFTVKSFK